jgi:FMN phosphatase YigB (HAD superfamily)
VYDLCRDIGIDIYIDGYYCAHDSRSSAHIKQYTCDMYSINNSWKKIKTLYLKMICERENINKSNIYFFDDLPENIYTAQHNGFTKSIRVDSHKYPDITDEYNLVEVLKNILGLV